MFSSNLKHPKSFHSEGLDWWQATFPDGLQFVQITDATERAVSIAYGECGTGQPLIFVHGIGTWSYCWRHNIDALAQHYRVICFDAKGYGFSEKPLHSNVLGHQINEFAQMIQKLCDEPVVAVAESMGALVTLATVEAYPALFARLVLINVPIFPQNLPSWGMRWMARMPLKLVQSIAQFRLVRLLAPIIRMIVRQVRREISTEGAVISVEEVYWLTYPYIEFSQTITKLAEDLKQFAQEIYLLQQERPNLIRDIQSRLPAVIHPTLILWGEQDRWFPVKDGEALHNNLPHSIFKVLPNCAHQAASGRPDLVNAEILEFLRLS